MKRIAVVVALCLAASMAFAQPAGKGAISRYSINLKSYTPVTEYELPDVLLCNDGKIVKNVRQWEKKRRPEIMSIYEQEILSFSILYTYNS